MYIQYLYTGIQWTVIVTSRGLVILYGGGEGGVGRGGWANSY